MRESRKSVVMVVFQRVLVFLLLLSISLFRWRNKEQDGKLISLFFIILQLSEYFLNGGETTDGGSGRKKSKDRGVGVSFSEG